MFKFLENLYFRRFEAERREATTIIVGRYSRGNTCTQDHRFLDKRAAAEIRAIGDKAVNRIQRKMAKAA